MPKRSDPVVSIRVSVEGRRELQAAADRAGVSVSAFCRDAALAAASSDSSSPVPPVPDIPGVKTARQLAEEQASSVLLDPLTGRPTSKYAMDRAASIRKSWDGERR